MKIIMRISAITFSFVLLVLTATTTFAATTPSITVGSASGKSGEKINIPVSIANNSGIIALYCSVDYDSTQIKLTKVTNGSVLTEPAHSGTLTAKPYRLCFDMSLAPENNTNNGVVATLEFEILSTARTGDTEISLTYNPEEIYNYNLNNVYFETLSGKVSIISGNTQATQPGNTTNESSSESSSESDNNTGSTTAAPSSKPDKIEIDVEPKDTSPTSDTVLEVAIDPNNNTPWDKVIIGGSNIQDRNITTEQTDKGLLIHGDDPTWITVEIQENGKTVSVDIDIDKNEILLRENENGYIEVFADEDGDGEFETPLIQPLPFEDITDNLFPTALKTFIPIILVVIIIGFIMVIIRKKAVKIKKNN